MPAIQRPSVELVSATVARPRPRGNGPASWAVAPEPRDATRSRAGSHPRLCYFGAGPDTGNLGVSALCYAVVGSLAQLDPGVHLTVFDHTRGLRRETIALATRSFEFERCGAYVTRRLYRRESMWHIRLCCRLGGWGNPSARRLRACDAVLDISGGDSFTDLYGMWRFASVVYPKRLALELGKPLILLPQTYGPYRAPRARRIASEIVRRAAMAWARDPRSFDVLKDLLGPDFDPARHRTGVDVAFALEPSVPRVPLPEPIAGWLAGQPDTRTVPVIGFNVSGLIWHDPVAMRERYGFQADYRDVVLGFLRRVLRESNARILLVPHVLTPPGHYESDSAANEAVFAALTAAHDGALGRALSAAARARVARVPPVYAHPSEMKWIIAHCDWFCGMRMHACIAGLSSGVPTAAIAYSLKTQGVFETCGQGGCVVDPRVLDTAAAVDGLVAAWSARATVAETLRARVAAVRAQAAEPFRALGAGLAASASFPPVGVHP